MSKIKSEGTQLFNIPNNEEGMAFLQSCKKYLNTKRYKFSRRGRGPRGSKFSKGYDSHVSLRKADSTWFAVYAGIKETEREKRDRLGRWEKEFQATTTINSMQLKIMSLETQLSNTKGLQVVNNDTLMTKDIKVLVGNRIYELK